MFVRTSFDSSNLHREGDYMYMEVIVVFHCMQVIKNSLCMNSTYLQNE